MMAKTSNIRIRIALLESSMKQWELANILGISEATMARRLRVELSDEEQNRIIKAIHDNAKEDD